MPHKDSESTSFGGRTFHFKAAPHLRGDHEDWHAAYIEIITRFLDDAEVRNRDVQLPAFPLLSALSCNDLLFEVASYWEGALYFLCRVLGSSTPLRGLRAVEEAVTGDCACFREQLFMAIWNSHGQVKWLKAHLIREQKQQLLPCPISSCAEIRKAAQRHGDDDLFWLASFVEQHADEGEKYPNPYFGGMNPLHLGLVLYKNAKDTANLFSHYKQRENHFTNGLIGVLTLAETEDLTFIPTFFRELLLIEVAAPLTSAQVLEDYPVSCTADAVLTAKNTTLFLETKIVSATLKMEQIQKHLLDLQGAAEESQYLVLLTPDDSRSGYVRGYLDLDAARMRHLEWKRVYEYLSRYQCKTRVLRAVIKQYLSTIQDMIFEQDIVGIISKVSFGDHSEVYADCYLDEMRAGKWAKWNTPKRYKNLDGTGRKLLLYDKERKAITVEVEIARVEETNEEQDYPFTNWFAEGTLDVLSKPIGVEVIESIDGFENFTHERAPYRNVTHEQYKLLRAGT